MTDDAAKGEQMDGARLLTGLVLLFLLVGVPAMADDRCEPIGHGRCDCPTFAGRIQDYCAVMQGAAQFVSWDEERQLRECLRDQECVRTCRPLTTRECLDRIWKEPP